MNVSRPAPFVADTNVPDISKLNQDHWKSPDPYTRLGLPRGASINVIKSRYRRLALKYHPDKSNFVHTTARFQAVTEAYKLLTGMG
jgi:DnaJ-class molecular chaperone